MVLSMSKERLRSPRARLATPYTAPRTVAADGAMRASAELHGARAAPIKSHIGGVLAQSGKEAVRA
jgi:hypothetical protein